MSWLADGTIQRLKQQYNQKGCPTLEVTLAEVQEDLRTRPPQVLSLEELQLTNGAANGHLEPVPASGESLLVLSKDSSSARHMHVSHAVGFSSGPLY